MSATEWFFCKATQTAMGVGLRECRFNTQGNIENKYSHFENQTKFNEYLSDKGYVDFVKFNPRFVY
jgi:hypothetical protein